jgi:hypothetical protein
LAIAAGVGPNSADYGSMIFLQVRKGLVVTAIGGSTLPNMSRRRTNSLCRRGEPFRPRTPRANMTTIRGSARYAGLLPVEPSDEPSPIRPTTLENECDPNRKPSLRKRGARALCRLLIASCAGVAATLAWWSYGGVARQMIASSYPRLGWLAPRGAITAPKTRRCTRSSPAFPHGFHAPMAIKLAPQPGEAVALRQCGERSRSMSARGVRCFAANDLELAENRQ